MGCALAQLRSGVPLPLISQSSVNENILIWPTEVNFIRIKKKKPDLFIIISLAFIKSCLLVCVCLKLFIFCVI